MKLYPRIRMDEVYGEVAICRACGVDLVLTDVPYFGLVSICPTCGRPGDCMDDCDFDETDDVAQLRDDDLRSFDAQWTPSDLEEYAKLECKQ